ncbi:MAG TPA: uracil-DNA glycosylase [Caulobacteraceae bacterium]
MTMTLDHRAAESLLAFWSETGVDTLYEEAARDRMAEAARPAARKASPTEIVKAPANSGPGKDLAWAAGDLEALAAAIAAFDGCALKGQGARQAVCWRGEVTAPVMIVGEAPGADEDRQGAPFVGRAGQLLDRMLAAAGLTERVLITNTVFWRPPGNRTPTPEEQLACRPFLERAIDLVRPKLLLLVGAAAARSMLDQKDGILSLRGRWFEWRARHVDLEIPALPTLHPAFLLRQPAAKKKAWKDLLMLAERLDRGARPD